MIRYMSSKLLTTVSATRRKGADTKICTLEKRYGKDFGVQNDKALWNYFKNKGFGSLSRLLGDE